MSLKKALGGVILSRLFGDGLAADVAGRGTVYLADEVRKAIDHDEEQLTQVRLRPGQSYTVIARPPATRRERRLAARQRGLRERDRRQRRPSRRQLRTARRLERTQHRLDRARPGGRRERKLLERERRTGERFDRLMRPTPRQARTRAELAEVTDELDRARSVSFAAARSKLSATRRRRRVRVYE